MREELCRRDNIPKAKCGGYAAAANYSNRFSNVNGIATEPDAPFAAFHSYWQRNARAMYTETQTCYLDCRQYRLYYRNAFIGIHLWTTWQQYQFRR